MYKKKLIPKKNNFINEFRLLNNDVVAFLCNGFSFFERILKDWLKLFISVGTDFYWTSIVSIWKNYTFFFVCSPWFFNSKCNEIRQKKITYILFSNHPTHSVWPPDSQFSKLYGGAVHPMNLYLMVFRTLPGFHFVMRLWSLLLLLLC